jgi:aspartyl-tRNA(Asn)/glutamyl-tRNA(Gln) amidotransferase subunit A
LAKFDGLRFGRRTEKKSEDLFSYYLQTRREGLGAESRRGLFVGSYVLSAGYVDQYYLQAQRVRTKLREDFDRVFKEVDLLLTPTTPTTAFGLGEKIDDPISMYLSDIYTVSVNLAGLPALSVPAGLADGLPVGLQIIGPRFGEDKILRLGHFFEQLRGEFPSPEL